ncbi:MAG: prolyl oligopeptidase family serine peptidase [Acidobacteriota bacterium]|nr:prolyl oligopeptidase family serine peptidase [Acidobacteriota bacterium]
MYIRTLIFLAALSLSAAELTYQKPPQVVEDVLNAPATPVLSLSPARTHVILAQPLRYPPIADLAQPTVRLAGLRMNPKNNGSHRGIYATKLTLKRLSDGAETVIALPAGAKPGIPRWSPDGSMFAFTNTAADRIELWVCATATGVARKLDGVRLNTVVAPGFGGNDSWFQWTDDNRTLLVELVPSNRGAVPAEVAVPTGPHVQESSGRAGPVRTYEDMLNNPHDEDLFDYYATAQLAFADTQTGKIAAVGTPAVFQSVRPSPDGKHLLTVRVHRPYSYLHPMNDFPKEVEIWDRAGKVERKIASLGLEDRVPIQGVPAGPRNYMWQPSTPATFLWVEALDAGDPRKKAPFRDRVLMIKEPFQAEPVEVVRTEQRLQSMTMGEKTTFAIVTDYERDKRWTRAFEVDLEKPGAPPRLLWERNAQDRYKDPGQPVMARSARRGGILQDGDNIYFSGLGATPEGDRPFLDRYNIKTHKSERVFRSDANAYEVFEGLLEDNGSKFITRRESPSEPPNYYVRSGSALTPLTKFADPTPQLRGIEKRLVTYKRPDGVPLSFTLYLPPGYQAGTRLPTVVWAYPLEFNDADTAGQISGSTQRFTTIVGMSHLFFLLQGYAILDNAAMPVVGTPETVNNTYIEQVVADAKAAIDKAVEIGVTERERVGVGGHSYGAFMTANLLAHSDLFKAGIARSGAYNRTLTAFGFQSERRTLWEAPETYLRMSPFLQADKIKRPILLIHGEADDNQGTFPIQSERMYQAIRGNGGIVRYVTLPFEPHGYMARESIEHTLWEMIGWFDKYVKNAGGVHEEQIK